MEKHDKLERSGKSGKKKEYLFEFLIVFVAITGSFFAENLREHFIDKHKVKEYMESMLQDLKDDTISLDRIIMQNKEQIKGIDSLLNIMGDDMSGNEVRLFYYYDLKYTSNYNGFMPVKRTVSQLINTGALELVKIKSVSDGIVNYDNSGNAVLKQGDLLDNRFKKNLELQTEIIDLLSLKKLQPGSTFLQLKDFPALLTTDKIKLHAYYFNITIFKGAILGYTQRLESLNEQAADLIHMIQDEYNLKE